MDKIIILDLIRQRDIYSYQYKKSKDKDVYKVFCQFRNNVQKEIKTAKSFFFQTKLKKIRKVPETCGNN